MKGKKEMVTQEQIARNLHISRTTVARAFKGQFVSEETRKKVLEEAKRLGYEPNAAATSLALKNTKDIYAFIIATIDEGYGRQTKEGIMEAARMWKGYNFEIHVIFTDITKGSQGCRIQMEQFFEVINKEKADGIIFSALSQENMDWVERVCREKRLPLMTLDMIYKCDNLCHVGPDYFNLGTYSAAYIAGLMMKRGYILTLGYDEGYELSKLRMEGFHHKLKEYPEIVCRDVNLEQISSLYYRKILEEEFRKQVPVAVYAPYHVDYIGDFLKEKGLEHQVITISNGINEKIEKYLFDGTIDGIVSARPYFLGAVAASNFFKYFFRKTEMLQGTIDVSCDIYIKENYNRYDKIF
ncbi:LacI family DNA-binding transcriptional regulator [Lachnoclostridium edouardi]|uniref:LacI family DNA-binding transcriptional regulator n=1 Tax=Lachnoclostridium edouardi TaxID=1926283 RepID=UPI000C7CDA0C|nr:LacI family DNA-binding transcriptional regulator [Lachnoclostridium edouardi]